MSGIHESEAQREIYGYAYLYTHTHKQKTWTPNETTWEYPLQAISNLLMRLAPLHDGLHSAEGNRLACVRPANSNGFGLKPPRLAFAVCPGYLRVRSQQLLWQVVCMNFLHQREAWGRVGLTGLDSRLVVAYRADWSQPAEKRKQQQKNSSTYTLTHFNPNKREEEGGDVPWRKSISASAWSVVLVKRKEAWEPNKTQNEEWLKHAAACWHVYLSLRASLNDTREWDIQPKIFCLFHS